MEFPKRPATRAVSRICSLLLLLPLVVSLCTGCSRNDIIYGDLSAEDLAIALLEDNRDDVEAAIADLQQMQQDGVLKAYVRHDPDSPVEISLTYASEYVTNTIEDRLYHRLMKRFIAIDMYEDGTIAFHSRGFLRGYSGFYYSTTGQKHIEHDADWYETHPLEENFYFFNFGY